MTFRRGRELELDAPLGKPLANAVELNIDDLLEFLFGERVENNHLVDAVQKLRPEMLTQLVEHRRAHDRVVRT